MEFTQSEQQREIEPPPKKVPQEHGQIAKYPTFMSLESPNREEWG